MHYRSILFIIGNFICGFGGMMLLPAVVAAMYHETSIFYTFLNCGLGTIALGAALVIMMRGKHEVLGHRDAFLLTFLTWFLLSLIGALPFWIAGVAPHFTDALFESTSGLTTTGASVLSNLNNMSHGILFWRSLSQWLGGMGIVVLGIAILPFLGIGGLQLFRSEMPGVVKDKLQPRIKETAKLLWTVYLILTILCAAGYSFAGMNTFDAINHAFTTISAAGFSTKDASIGFYDSFAIELVAALFMIVGAVNFSLHYLLFASKGRLIYANDPEFKWFALTMLGAIGVIAAVLTLNQTYGLAGSFREALFTTVSTMTTTGFAVTDYSVWPVFCVALLMILMLCGGCTGSAAGGIKFMRIILVFLQGFRELRRLLHPKSVVSVKLGDRNIDPNHMQAVWSFIALFIICLVVISLSLTLFGIPLIEAFSAAGATITSLGPGLGEIGPVGNYAELPQGAKLILCFSMLLGRLELFTILVLFMPAYWRK